MEWDLTALPKKTRDEIHEIFTKDFQLKVLQAIREQTMMRALDDCEQRRSVNGLGGRKYQVHAFVDTIWRRYYGHNYSHDKDLMQFLARRNPEIVTRSGGTKVQFGYAPGGKSRFRKTY